jgi:hypothetical protein
MVFQQAQLCNLVHRYYRLGEKWASVFMAHLPTYSTLKRRQEDPPKRLCLSIKLEPPHLRRSWNSPRWEPHISHKISYSCKISTEGKWHDSRARGIFGIVWSQSFQLGSCSEIGDSQRGREAVNTKVEGSTALEDVARAPVNTEQSEKS